MNYDLIVICALLAINLVIAIACLVFNILRERRNQGIAVFILMLAFPIVAVVMIAIGNVARVIWKFFGTKEINYQELTFSKERMHLMTPADIQKSLNTVSVEEALIESDLEDRRKTFVDLLKGDEDDETLPLIRRSVESTDTEVAHYAASFVASTVVTFKSEEAQYYQELEEELTPQSAQRYIQHVEKMASSGFVSQLELATYAPRLIQVAESFYVELQEHFLDDDVRSVVTALENMGREQELEVWIHRAYLRAWTSLVCFKLCANHYFKIHDRDRLFALLDESKHHSLTMDKEAVDWVRMFDTGSL